MFDDEFFPTPSWVVAEMWRRATEGDEHKDYYILEPSAGKGDILDHITKHTGRHKMYAIEQNPELRMILQEKGYKVVDTDFLSYNREVECNLILMNPPFSNGDEHLLKAIDIMENGRIVCLLNRETIDNPYTEKRKLLAKMLEDNGATFDYLGDCFTISERKTGVQVVMVTVDIVTNVNRFDFEGYDTERVEMSEEKIGDALATNDIVQNIIDDYARAKKLFEDGLMMIKKADTIAKGIAGNYQIDAFKIANQSGSLQWKLIDFVDEMRDGVWKQIAEKINIEKFMTTKVRDDFRSFMRSQGNFAITHKNVATFVEFVLSNRVNIMERAIEEVFDEFTRHHHENRCHVEGWKTNDSWKVNKKVILPNYIQYRDWSSSAFSLRFGNETRISDIDKALCFITGKQYERIRTMADALEYSFRHGTGEADSEFFTMKYYKKESLHITFKDEFVWQEFNMRACNQKNWLPPEEKDAWKQKQNTFTL